MVISYQAGAAIARGNQLLLAGCFLFPRADTISVVLSEWQELVHPQKNPSYSRS